MERMKKIGTLPLRNAAQVGPSRIGIGFDIGHQSVEKLHTRSAARSEILISHL